MKKLLFIMAVLFISGCAGMMATYAPFTEHSVEAGEEKVAGIGDIFFMHSNGQTMTDPMLAPSGITASGDRYELTIVELNQERLGLQYNEFTFSPGTTIGYTYVPGGWMVKQGFNKRFDYAISDKIIRFKGYEFEVLSVENGQIKYRRLK